MKRRYLARLHGYVCGDGSAGIYTYPYKKKKPHLNIKIDDRGCLDKILESFKVLDYRPSVAEREGKYGTWFIIQAQEERTVRKILSVGSIGSYGWEIPDFKRKLYLREWISAFFDSDSTVTRPNREITIESVNSEGLSDLKRELNKFGVSSYKKCRKNRDVYLLRICGREDLENFYNKVGFNHLKKEESLKLALASYQKYYGHSWEPPHIEDRKTAEKFLTDFLAERGYFRVKKQGYGSFEIGLHNSKAITEISTLLQKYFNIDLSVSTTPDKQDRCWIWISRISELEKLLESGLLRNAPEKENSLRTFVTSRN